MFCISLCIAPLSAATPTCPFEMPEVIIPSFKTDTFPISDFGAISDGVTDNQAAISKAINTCSHQGGGVVLIPEGIWLTGPITLKDNVNLHVSNGALIKFSRNFDAYPLVKTSYEGLDAVRCQSPINGRQLTNIAITGSGIIDGSGDAWRGVNVWAVTANHWKRLLAKGGKVFEKHGIWYPTESSYNGHMLALAGKLPSTDSIELYQPIKDFCRPVLVSLIECDKVLLDGTTFQNSPAWNIHPLMCTNITLRNLFIKNPSYSQNGDGLDLESCRLANIRNCRFDVGDDAICIKSGKDADGRRRARPTELVTITDCTVYHAHGGFVVGSEMSGDVRKIFVSNCLFIGTDNGLRFKSTRGRGGIVEDIYVENINMIDIPKDAIRFNLYYWTKTPDGGEETPVIVDETTPQFKGLHFKNITCAGADRALFIQGLPEMYVEDITLENITIKSKKGVICNYANNISITNFKLTLEEGDAISFKNSSNTTFTNLSVNGQTKKVINVEGKESHNIHFRSPKAEIKRSDIFIANECKRALKIDKKTIK